MNIPTRDYFRGKMQTLRAPDWLNYAIEVYDALISKAEQARDEWIDEAVNAMNGCWSQEDAVKALRSLKSKPRAEPEVPHQMLNEKTLVPTEYRVRQIVSEELTLSPLVTRSEVVRIAEDAARKIVEESSKVWPYGGRASKPTPKRFAELSSVHSSSAPIRRDTIHKDINGVEFMPCLISRIDDNTTVVVWEEIVKGELASFYDKSRVEYVRHERRSTV